MRRARYFAVTAGVLALAGCGDTMLDNEELEAEIIPAIERQTGTKNVDLSCPDDVKAETGATFECDVTAQGGIEAKVEVTQKDDDGHVRWKLLQP
jgi:hypothetical protein